MYTIITLLDHDTIILAPEELLDEKGSWFVAVRYNKEYFINTQTGELIKTGSLTNYERES